MTDAVVPPRILFEGDGHKYAEDSVTGKRIPGVTSIGGLISKDFLQRWSANKASEYAVDHIDEIVRLLVDGKFVEAENRIGGAAYRETSAAAQLGTKVHKMYERLADGEEVGWVPEQMAPFLGNWEQFIAEYHPTFVDQEFSVWNPELGYFGTADWCAVIDGQLVLGDTKAGNGVYDTVALQLSAYRYAPYILRTVDGETVVEDNREYEATVVLHTRPEGWALHPINTGPEVFSVFKALATEVMPWHGWKGVRGLGKDAINAPVNQSPFKRPVKAPRHPSS
ncbi:hypothetical protein [Fodinicola feengrottensis]|uniref:Exonuclease n=1 Tax=Fodinicola feengrottensis TaxID=435914 RepID=A0ABN2IAZ3_9ACTN|nr:hypothetical protein [Fodinicola feengrottensis]